MIIPTFLTNKTYQNYINLIRFISKTKGCNCTILDIEKLQLKNFLHS
jgi:hypothetical protein